MPVQPATGRIRKPASPAATGERRAARPPTANPPIPSPVRVPARVLATAYRHHETVGPRPGPPRHTTGLPEPCQPNHCALRHRLLAIHRHVFIFEAAGHTHVISGARHSATTAPGLRAMRLIPGSNPERATLLLPRFVKGIVEVVEHSKERGSVDPRRCLSGEPRRRHRAGNL